MFSPDAAFLKGDEKMKKETLDLLREFKKQWYPARDVPQIKDFIAWLERKGYELIKSKNPTNPTP